MKKKYELVLNILTPYIGKRSAVIVVCLVLFIFGHTNAEINADFGVSWGSLRKYRKAFETNDVKPLFTITAQRKQSELAKHDDKIMESFNKKPPKTLREAQKRIEKLTGLKRSINRIRIYLKKGA